MSLVPSKVRSFFLWGVGGDMGDSFGKGFDNRSTLKKSVVFGQ